MAVVFYHYTARHDSSLYEAFSPFTQYGYLGVPLFFIISGYVIALSASNRSATEFAVSRFVRLYPAYWSGIAITLVFASIYGSYEYNLIQVLANLTMLNDYLGIRNIDDVYWTLQAELKFYACIFILVYFNYFAKHKIWLSIWLALTVLFLFTEQPSFLGILISPFYSSFFIAGVAFYLIYKEGVNKYNMFIISVSLLVSSYWQYHLADEFIRDTDVFIKLVSVSIVWVFYVLFYLIVTDRIKLTSRKIYTTLGALTYPLYLIHGVAGRHMINDLRERIPEGIAVTITIALMLFISYLVHKLIEKKTAPVIKRKLLNLLSRKTA